MFDNEKRALELIEHAKEELDLKGGTLCSNDRPQTASEWMAWMLDHVVEDMHRESWYFGHLLRNKSTTG